MSWLHLVYLFWDKEMAKQPTTIGTPLANPRHERFTINLFRGLNQRESGLGVGYALSRVDATASHLVRNVKIIARLKELNDYVAKKTVSDKIMEVEERKEKLSEIGRETVVGRAGVVRVGNLGAIDLLNKMDKVYGPEVKDPQEGGVTELTDEELILIIRRSSRRRVPE